jgi:N utilization substance protein B
MKRRKAREYAVQVSYQVDVAKNNWQEALYNVIEDLKPTAFLEQLIEKVYEHQTEIDALLIPNLNKWSLGRLSVIDRAILRLAVCELLYLRETPREVVLNEAVELAKTFGSDQSSKFINGVLAGTLRQMQEE